MVKTQKEKTFDLRMRVFKKALGAGMTNEEAFIKQTAQSFFIMQKTCKFSNDEVEEYFNLVEAIKKKKFFDYLSVAGEYAVENEPQ